MTEPAWHIAQLNVARAIAPLDSPALADFVAALDHVNALAEAAPGFIWRLKDDVRATTTNAIDGDPQYIANMSVWRSVDALFQFVYRSAHTPFMLRRREWFEKPAQAYQVLWWIAAGHAPTLDEGMAKLAHLRVHGPTAEAFTFKARFPAPSAPGTPEDMRPEPYCVGWA